MEKIFGETASIGGKSRSMLTAGLCKKIVLQGGFIVKQHRFWAWGAVICMIMVIITGYKHK